MSAISLLYCTTRDEAEALAIGRALVEERLAACINVLPGMTSCYRWEGRVEEAREAVLIVKTTAELVAACTARIRASHSYQVPCVLELPVGRANADYADWLRAGCRGPAAS